jgi:hypothetical protein
VEAVELVQQTLQLVALAMLDKVFQVEVTADFMPQHIQVVVAVALVEQAAMLLVIPKAVTAALD